MNFYKHFIGDYQRKTAALSMVEHGAYRLLLDAFYATGEPLPSDRKAMYRLIRADGPVERRAVDTILAKFWHESPQGWVNARALEEITEATTKSVTNRDTALAREAARRAAREEHERAQDREHETSTKTAPRAGDHSHSQIPEKPPSTPRSAGAARFADFWGEWPTTDRKVNRKGCEAKWRAKRLDEKADAIISHVVAMKATRKWLEGFEPRPDTYLAQELWNDGVPEARQPVDLNERGEARQWHESAPGIVGKGAEHGLREEDFPHFPAFKDAVYAAAGHVPSRAH